MEHERHALPELDGIVNLAKPIAWSSAKAVTAVRDAIGGRRRKMGHAGTLDPRASGVLVLLVGQGTHLAELLMDAGKEYIATVRLGATSATDDVEGQLSPRPGAVPPTEAQIDEALRQFVGRVEQIPPTFSALKIGGQRSYVLAKKGRKFQPAPRTISIDSIERLDYRWPDLRLRICCGRGTYIRTLARDIGEALNVGGHLAGLERTRVGPFTLDSAVKPSFCLSGNVADWLLPLERAVEHLTFPDRRLTLDAEQAALASRGAGLEASRIASIGPLLAEQEALKSAEEAIGPIALFDPAGRLVSLAELCGIAMMPVHVLRPTWGGGRGRGAAGTAGRGE